MISFTLADFVQSVRAKVRGKINLEQVPTAILTDSRQVVPGSVFVALKGERFDGHCFVEEAVAKGAIAVLVSVEALPKFEGRGYPLLFVEDTLTALGQIAHAYRRRLQGVKVLAVTGSSGKTTTKELLAFLLAEAGPVLKAEASYNNEVGVPLTLLKGEEFHRYVVLEMGMRGPGEIAYLTRIAEPEVGIITNIGTAHIGRLGSQEAIAQAKGELLEGLAPDGVAVLPAEDPFFPFLCWRNRANRVITFGLSQKSMVRGELLESDVFRSRVKVLWPGGEAVVDFPLSGRHHLLNLCAGVAGAFAVGVDPSRGLHRLTDFHPPAMRSRLVEAPGGFLILEDCYNANFESMTSALEVLRSWRGRRIAVLGDMLELGEFSSSLHFRVGENSAKSTDLLITLGEQAQKIAEGALSAGMPKSAVLSFAKVEDAEPFFKKNLVPTLGPGDLILVKASRAMQLERVVNWLRQASSPSQEGAR